MALDPIAGPTFEQKFGLNWSVVVEETKQRERERERETERDRETERQRDRETERQRERERETSRPPPAAEQFGKRGKEGSLLAEFCLGWLCRQ